MAKKPETILLINYSYLLNFKLWSNDIIWPKKTFFRKKWIEFNSKMPPDGVGDKKSLKSNHTKSVSSSSSSLSAVIFFCWIIGILERSYVTKIKSKPTFIDIKRFPETNFSVQSVSKF